MAQVAWVSPFRARGVGWGKLGSALDILRWSFECPVPIWAEVPSELFLGAQFSEALRSKNRAHLKLTLQNGFVHLLFWRKLHAEKTGQGGGSTLVLRLKEAILDPWNGHYLARTAEWEWRCHLHSVVAVTGGQGIRLPNKIQDIWPTFNLRWRWIVSKNFSINIF